MWITWCFDTNHDFCESSYEVSYDNFQIKIERGEQDNAHNLQIETTENMHNSAYEAILGFLSELSWLFQTKALLVDFWIPSAVKCNLKNRRIYTRILNSIDLTCYKQIAQSNIQKMALGFYREGITSNSALYGFLNYYKIIMINYPTRNESSDWINKNISKVSRQDLVNNINNMHITNIGEYLYKSGRCALAHCDISSGEPIVNPNSYDDTLRIARELQLIKELAEICMKDELKIPKRF